MAIDTASPRSRRALLGAGLGALAATAVSALGASSVADATSSVVLGGSNAETTTTAINNTAADIAAVAISGRVTHPSGSTASAGVKGQDDGANGTGVAGYATNGPTARGVYGQSTAGRGVEGASATSIGVFGHSPSGKGVQGNSGTGTGVYGASSSIGVYGVSTNGTGVYGASTGGYGVWGESPAGGVYGHSPSGKGVQGYSTSGIGVYGHGTDGYGVYGYSSATHGVFGNSAGTGTSGVHGENAAAGGYGVTGATAGANGRGVYGTTTGTFGAGIQGENTGYDGYGVMGYSNNASSGGYGVYGVAGGPGGIGVYGYQWTGAAYAGYFEGNVFTTGTHNAPISRMVVDHPDAPADRYYQQTLVGSFEQVSTVSGNATTGADGSVTVKVPLLFARYHTDVRYQFTPFGSAVVPYVAQRLNAKGTFVIATDKPGTEVSWQLTGVRSDPAALKQPLRVDTAKPARYRGRYIQPALYSQPRSKSLIAPRPQPRVTGPARHPKAP